MCQTPSTGLRHPSFKEGAGKRCSECDSVRVFVKDVKGPLSIQQTLERFQRQRWGSFGHVGWIYYYIIKDFFFFFFFLLLFFVCFCFVLFLITELPSSPELRKSL